MDCAILYKDHFTDKLEWIEESRKMKLSDPKELEVFGIDGRMSQLGYYGLDQLRQGFKDDSTFVQFSNIPQKRTISVMYQVLEFRNGNHSRDSFRIVQPCVCPRSGSFSEGYLEKFVI